MLIGLTGGIACGKSTALKTFSNLGWKSIDADAICHNLYERRPLELVDALSSRWPRAEIFDKDQRINRKAIADIVFSNKRELAWLNATIHPMVMNLAQESILESSKDRVIFDVPLLFEANWEATFERVIAVWVDRRKCIARLKERNWTEKEINRREAYQFSADEKLQKADFAIINTGDMSFLTRQCEFISEILLKE